MVSIEIIIVAGSWFARCWISFEWCSYKRENERIDDTSVSVRQGWSVVDKYFALLAREEQGDGDGARIVIVMLLVDL